MSKTIDVNDLISEPNAIALLSSFKDNTDPKYIGPGTWNVIHRRAAKATMRQEQLQFISFMKDVCYNFPCLVCRGHCTEYINNHPIEDYLDAVVDIGGQKLPIGLFVWSWKFHNAVNIRIKKPIMSWLTAYNLYLSPKSTICSKTCQGSDNHDEDTNLSNNTIEKQTPVQRFRLISNGRKSKSSSNY